MDKMNQVFKDAKGFAVGRWVFFISLAVLMAVSLMAACAPPTPEVIEKEVVVEKPVVKTVVVEKEVIVEKPVFVEKEVVVEEPVPTPTPVPFDCYDSEEESRVCIAQTAGVAVVVPWQDEVGPVDVVSLPLGAIQDLPGNDDFMPTRLVIDFKVVDADGKTVTDFAPDGITILVIYTEEDVRKAGGLDRLILGYWHEELEQWNVLTWSEQPPSPLLSLGPGSVGLASAKVSSWGDRHIAWGD